VTFEQFRNTKFFPSLDGLRCLSIVAVLLFHSDSKAPGLFGAHGSAGVDLFFVISGFLITTLLLRERDLAGGISLRNFYARRTLRIFPLYYAVLLIFCCAAYALDRHSAPGQEFFRHLPFFAVYLNNLVIDLGPRRVIFAFSWSLATEEQFYVFWPSILAFSRRRWVPPVAIASLMSTRWLMDSLLQHGVVDFGDIPNRVATSVAPAICMGCLLAFALNDRAWFAALRGPLTSRWAAPVTAALVFTLSTLSIDINFLRASMVLLLASVVVSQDHLLKPVLENRLVRHVGTVSYGIYLMFTLVLNLGVRALHISTPSLKFCWTFTVTTLVATFVYRFYEKPFLRLKSRFSKERVDDGVVPETVSVAQGGSV
jgi:peptidoglycan/LPS O-acetylase OafA/YrhL